MEVAVIALAVACTLQAMALVVVLGTLPFLWWRMQSLEAVVAAEKLAREECTRDIAKLDLTLDTVLSAASGGGEPYAGNGVYPGTTGRVLPK